MIKKISIIILFICFKTTLFAQYGIDEPSKYFGFDANPLLAQVVPLSKIRSNTFNASIVLRRYNSNNNGVRMSYGIGLDDNSTVSSLYLSIDYDKRYSIGNRWIFFHGIGPSLKIASQNNFNRNTSASRTFEQVLAIGGHWGVEYILGDVVTLSTEASLRLGKDLSGFGGGVFRLNAPVNVMVHFNIFGK